MDGKRIGMNVSPITAWTFKSIGRLASYAGTRKGKENHIGIYIQQAREYLTGNNQVSPSSPPPKGKVDSLLRENDKDCLSTIESILAYPQMGAIAHKVWQTDRHTMFYV